MPNRVRYGWALRLLGVFIADDIGLDLHFCFWIESHLQAAACNCLSIGRFLGLVAIGKDDIGLDLHFRLWRKLL